MSLAVAIQQHRSVRSDRGRRKELRDTRAGQGGIDQQLVEFLIEGEQFPPPACDVPFDLALYSAQVGLTRYHDERERVDEGLGYRNWRPVQGDQHGGNPGIRELTEARQHMPAADCRHQHDLAAIDLSQTGRACHQRPGHAPAQMTLTRQEAAGMGKDRGEQRLQARFVGERSRHATLPSRSWPDSAAYLDRSHAGGRARRPGAGREQRSRMRRIPNRRLAG